MTLAGLLDLLCVWMFQSSQILGVLLLRTSRKKFSTCCLGNILGIIVLFPSVYQILLVHGIVPFVQQLVSINAELF